MVLKVWTALVLVLTASIFSAPFAHSISKTPGLGVNPSASIGPIYLVSLDANSLSQTDVNLAPTASQSKSFRVGAVINSSATNPLTGVWGWQFGITYNASAFVPQGDPGSSTYPDGALTTVLFGSQATAGTVNWAARAAALQAFGGSTVCQGPGCGPAVPPWEGKILVYYTLLAPSSPVTISAATLLANVNFELVTKPSTSQSFNITEVVFAGPDASMILGPTEGLPVVETITNTPPQASFTASPDPDLGPFAFSFNATLSHDPDGTIPSPGGYFWDFGDGTQDQGLSGSLVAHDYGVNSSFIVTLRVQDDLGATGAARDSLGTPVHNSQPSHTERFVGLDLPPVASFIFSPNPTNSSLINFDASNSADPDGSILSYYWMFGDGSSTTSTQATVAHFFALPGNYTVTLTVVDNAGLTGTASATVPIRTITPATLVAVDMDPQRSGIQSLVTVPGPFTVGVDVLNVADLYAWQFQLNYNNTLLSSSNVTFGPFWQQAISNQQAVVVVKNNQTLGTVLVAFSLVGNTSHFTGSGILATIRFTPLALGSGKVQLSDVVLVDVPPHSIPASTQDGFVLVTSDKPPQASFTFSPSNPAVGGQVFFDGTSSGDPDGFVQNWFWSFGDGNSALGPQAYHTYSSPGNYTVTLTVTDNAGLSSSTSMIVRVTGQTDELPTASFTFSPTSPKVGDQVFFDGTLSFDPDGYIQNSIWYFGDGSVGFGAQPTHSYSSPGSFTVSLTVTDNAGLSATTTRTIQVRPDLPPTASFTFSPSNITAGGQVLFDGTSSVDPDGFIQNWFWNFGDGPSTWSGSQVYHTYSRPGNYTVTLMVTDNSGSTATATKLIQVHADQPPVVAIAFYPSNPIVGQQVFFHGNASDPDGFIQNFFWSFGDGSFSYYSGSTAYHSYGTPGNYTVTLMVTDNSGTSANATATVPVHPRPLHDVGIVQVYAYPPVVVSSQSVGIQIVVVNNGSSNETVSVTAYYGSNVIGTLNGIFLPANNCYYCSNNLYLNMIWDTSGVAAGNYTISATVFLPTDQNPSDNTMTDGQVQVLPPPTLTINPASGPIGTTIVLHGSGFPSLPPYYPRGIEYVKITFDSPTIGTTTTLNGQFNFTVSIPFTQPGPHFIEAVDLVSGAHTRISFQVLPTPPPPDLAVTIQTGAVYFPSDTVVITAQVTLNGLAANPSSFQLQLFRPNGSSVILPTKTLGPGMFTATYVVPKSGAFGTYVVLAKAHSSGPLDATVLGGFEVKPSWLNQAGPSIGAGVTATALVGLVAVAWRRGYFRKKEDDPLLTS